MGKTIISVAYKDKRTGQFGGRKYSYFCSLLVCVGDLVIAPTYKGNSVARVVETDVDANSIPKSIMDKLKTIEEFAPEKEAQ